LPSLPLPHYLKASLPALLREIEFLQKPALFSFLHKTQKIANCGDKQRFYTCEGIFAALSYTVVRGSGQGDKEVEDNTKTNLAPTRRKNAKTNTMQ
jgi:hypothetical protein